MVSLLVLVFTLHHLLSSLPPVLGTMESLQSVLLEGNSLRTLRRQIVAKGTSELLKYLRSRIETCKSFQCPSCSCLFQSCLSRHHHFTLPPLVLSLLFSLLSFHCFLLYTITYSRPILLSCFFCSSFLNPAEPVSSTFTSSPAPTPSKYSPFRPTVQHDTR